MIKLKEWCSLTETVVSTHVLQHLKSDASLRPHAVNVISKAIPGYYAMPSRIAELLQKLGKHAAAQFIQEKLPTTKSIRSGDLGEILCNAYVLEETLFDLGIKRLRWKDHRNMSMRGEDVLAFRLGSKGDLQILKAEVKSRAAMTTAVIEEARKGLSSYGELPSPHALGFVADRLSELGDKKLCDALDEVRLKGGVKATQVTHMLFTFSGSNPSALLRTNLTGYAGSVNQRYVALQMERHQAFIGEVFDEVGK